MVPSLSCAGLALMPPGRPNGGRTDRAPHRDMVMSRQGAAHRDNRSGRLSLFAVREFFYRRAVVAGRLPNPSVRGFDSFRRCVSTNIDNSTAEQISYAAVVNSADMPVFQTGAVGSMPTGRSAPLKLNWMSTRLVSGRYRVRVPREARWNEVEHGGLCGALIRRWIRFNSWHLDASQDLGR